MLATTASKHNVTTINFLMNSLRLLCNWPIKIVGCTRLLYLCLVSLLLENVLLVTLVHVLSLIVNICDTSKQTGVLSKL